MPTKKKTKNTQISKHIYLVKHSAFMNKKILGQEGERNVLLTLQMLSLLMLPLQLFSPCY